MKLIIINGENNDKKIEIHIYEDSMIEKIKAKLDEILNGKITFKLHPFKLIYKNVILTGHNSIKYYNICENDEIWFGKVQKYMKNDDVIIYVFLVGKNQDYDFMIFKSNDTILAVRSKLESIYPKIIHIWNADGKLMENDQIVTEIDTLKDYKLFIKCDDGGKNEINNTFNECCALHTQRWVDRYLFLDKIRDDNKNESTRNKFLKLIEQIRQIILSTDTVDKRLNELFSDMPASYLDSIFFLTGDLGIQIYCICSDGYRFLMNYCQCRDEIMKIFAYYLFFSIRASLAFFLNSRKKIEKGRINYDHSNFIELNKNESNKSIRCIAIDVLNYFVKYLNDSNNDWQFWRRLWTNQYILGSFNESQIENRISFCDKYKCRIILKQQENIFEKFTTIMPKTISDAKENMADLLKMNKTHLYCIKPEKDQKPNDDDAFEVEMIIEIVSNMEDIEVLEELGKGSFAKVNLCRDKTSNKQFALKKIFCQNEGDLYRNLFIFSKLNSSSNINNYIGLFIKNGCICIGMKYLSGRSLRSLLDKRKHLSEQEIVKISCEILTQINELHKLGIIHRDIKSDNIVFDELNYAKLIDFGISKYTNGLTSKDLIDKWKGYDIGNIYNMAPELIKGEPYSEKIDIWSFGMVIIEMVTGKTPFRNLTTSQIYAAIKDFKKYEFETNYNISKKLNHCIDLCLTKNPDERPSAEQLIKSEFFKV